MKTSIYALTDSHQEARNLSQILSGIYNFEKDNNTPFLIFDCGDIFKGIYHKDLSVKAYLKIKELLPQAQIFITLGNNDFGFTKQDFEYLKQTIKQFKEAGIHVLCSNLYDKKNNSKQNILPEYEIVEINNTKFLITGFCLNNASANKLGYELLPAETTLENIVNNLNEKYDRLVVLNHHWYTYSKALKDYSTSKGINIDLIIGGHEHSPIKADFENNIFYPLAFARTLYKMTFDEAFQNIEEIPLNNCKFIKEMEKPIIEYEEQTQLKKVIAKRVYNLTKSYSDACPLGTFISDSMRKAGKTDIAFHSTGFSMYPLRLADSNYITSYDIQQVTCARCTIEKVELTVKQIKEIFDNTTTFRMERDRGNTSFLQCSQNMSIYGKINPDTNKYEIVQIEIDNEKLLDENHKPITPNKTYTCTIDPFIGSGELNFKVFKDLPKTKVLKNKKEIPIIELLKNSLIDAEKTFNGNSEYPSFKYIDL